MKQRTKHVILILLILLVLPGSTKPGFKQSYELYYSDALFFIKLHAHGIQKICLQYNVSPSFITSIIFPEIVKYNAITDWIETKTLELLYITYGTDGADFSIGPAQIKPSFAEKTEQYLFTHSHLYLKYQELLPQAETAKEKRKIRIARLKDFYWQVRYACCMADIVNYRLGLTQLSLQKRVQLTATAYNCCFWCTREQLAPWLSTKAFPFGIHSQYAAYNYADISWFYYKHEALGIFNEYTGH